MANQVSDTERIAIILELETQRLEKNAKSAKAHIARLERSLDPLAPR